MLINVEKVHNINIVFNDAPVEMWIFNNQKIYFYGVNCLTQETLEQLSAYTFVPASDAEANALKAEYLAWCDEFKQSPYQELLEDVYTLAERKEYLLNQLTIKAMSFEDNCNKDMFFTSSLGFVCNGDRRTKDNLRDLYDYFELRSVGGVVSYRDYHNKDHALTKEKIYTLLLECVSNGTSLYDQKWTFEKRINSAQTLQELAQIDFTFVMADFSKGALRFSV